MKVYNFETLQSTQSKSLEIAKLHFNFPFLVLAGTQENGVGRRGDIWYSPKGNLYVTYVFSLLKNFPPEMSYNLCILVHETFTELGFNFKINYKYPNDLYLFGGKLGGIICEQNNINSHTILRIGIGINFINSPDLGSYTTSFLKAYYKDIPEKREYALKLGDKILDFLNHNMLA